EQLADAAEADDADGLAEDLDAVELAALPGALTQGRVGGGDLTGGGQHQGDRVLGGGVDVGGRRVHDHHAALGGRGHVDVVEADAGARDDLQLLARLEHLGVDGGGRAD